MQHRYTLFAIVGTTLLIGGALFFVRGGVEGNRMIQTSASAVATIEDGVQYVDITAQGGYFPRTTRAKAGVPTVIRMKTENTYDCSSALVIRDLSYEGRLQPTGVEEISVPVEKAQGTLKGMCSMAMYHFEVVFE